MLQQVIAITLLIYSFCSSFTIQAASNVYSLKIRTSFDTPPQLRNIDTKWGVTLLPLFTMSKRHITQRKKEVDVHEKKNTIGAITNIRFGPSKYWWLEFTTGLEREKAKLRGSDPFKTSHVGLDDFVFEGGYRFFIKDSIQLSFYGLAGLPVHRKVTLNDRYDPLVGVRVFRLGAGTELSYSFFDRLQRSFSAAIQARLIHGFKRSWFPILPHGFKIQPGDFTDLLLAIRFREKHTLIETGYVETFFANQGIITSTKKIKDCPYLKHSLYINIQHGCRIDHKNGGFIISGGFSVSRAKHFNEKALGTWLATTLLF